MTDDLMPDCQCLACVQRRRAGPIAAAAGNLITLVDSWGGWDITKISELRAALEKLRAALEGK